MEQGQGVQTEAEIPVAGTGSTERLSQDGNSSSGTGRVPERAAAGALLTPALSPSSAAFPLLQEAFPGPRVLATDPLMPTCHPGLTCPLLVLHQVAHFLVSLPLTPGHSTVVLFSVVPAPTPASCL